MSHRKKSGSPLVGVVALPALAALALSSSCGPGAQEVVAYTSVDQVFSRPVLRYCEQLSGMEVRALFDTEETKSTGVVNRLLAEAENPQADVFWSGDPVRSSLLVERGLVEAYEPAGSAAVPPAFRDRDGQWTGFAARARVLLVNTDEVSDQEMPDSLHDLASPRWRGRTAMANPLFGTTTMHVAALFWAWGEEEARAFLEGLRRNDVRIASSNGEVKRLVASGEVAFGLTDTDDAHEALGDGAPVRVVYPDQEGMGTLVMPTVAVLLRGGPHPERGRRLLDCLVSAEVERQLAESAAHMPLFPGVATPEGVRDVESIRAMAVDYGAVAQEMETIQPWLREWVGL